jgi:hypothetical protein
MIHVFLLEQNIDDGHGRLFKAEMRRINAMNVGFQVDIREDATAFTSEAEAKGKKIRRGVLLYDGGDGIVVFGPKHFADTLYELVSFPDRFLQAHKFEWYWVDDPEFARYPAKRKIGNRFGTYNVTPELVKQIRKGEKIAEMVDGQPKTLMPKYFSGTNIVKVYKFGGRR